MSSSDAGLGPTTRPIRRLRIIPSASAQTVTSARATGGRHRRPETGEVPAVPSRGPHAHSAEARSAVTDVVPAQRVARLTVPAPSFPFSFPASDETPLPPGA